MAKGKAKDPSAPAKAKSDRNTFSKEKAKSMGAAGIIKFIALSAVKMAARNDHAGTTAEAKKARKKFGNTVQPKWSPPSAKNSTGGSLYQITKNQTEPAYSELKSLAKSAAGDIESGNYSSDVKALVAFMQKGHGGGGVRNFDTSGLSDMANSL